MTNARIKDLEISNVGSLVVIKQENRSIEIQLNELPEVILALQDELSFLRRPWVKQWAGSLANPAQGQLFDPNKL